MQLRSAFREYYFRVFDDSNLPDRLDQREFGFSQFGEQGMKRHLSFKSAGQLRAYLVKEVPSDAYCSNALYRYPTLPMQEKEWIGASIIFDIDGKDLDLPCVSTHSYILCHACNRSELLYNDQEKENSTCPNCKAPISGSDRVSLPCSKCVDGSLEHVRRLMMFLEMDFGISSNDILTFFSGNNGFHVYVNAIDYLTLDSRARLDIVSYVTGSGLIPEIIGIRKATNMPNVVASKSRHSSFNFGWSSKIAHDLKIADKTTNASIVTKVEALGGYEALKNKIALVAAKHGAVIDPQVTSDIHRIFRLPGSINSKSSLAKIRCANVKEFNPFKEACVLGEQKMSVKLKGPVKFNLKGKSFRLSKESAELPAYAAAYLICKKLAEVEDSGSA